MKRLLFLFLLLPALAAAAPKAELWDLWISHDSKSDLQIDHGLWDGLLQAYLFTGDPSGVHLFDYSGVDAPARESLDGYLRQLQQVEVSQLHRDEQMAYWINLYNALTIQVILDHWPVSSIRDINLGGGGLLGRGPWDAPLVAIEGTEVSLNDIEHRILRPIWEDPRIHYAVNCGSIGCPNLQSKAFTRENLEELLEAGARAYVNHPRGVQRSDNTLYLSSIFDWFSEDFGADRGEVLEHIRGHADSETAESLVPFLDGKGRVRYRYDWSINAVR